MARTLDDGAGQAGSGGGFEPPPSWGPRTVGDASRTGCRVAGVHAAREPAVDGDGDQPFQPVDGVGLLPDNDPEPLALDAASTATSSSTTPSTTSGGISSST